MIVIAARRIDDAVARKDASLIGRRTDASILQQVISRLQLVNRPLMTSRHARLELRIRAVSPERRSQMVHENGKERVALWTS